MRKNDLSKRALALLNESLKGYDFKFKGCENDDINNPPVWKMIEELEIEAEKCFQIAKKNRYRKADFECLANILNEELHGKIEEEYERQKHA